MHLSPQQHKDHTGILGHLLLLLSLRRTHHRHPYRVPEGEHAIHVTERAMEDLIARQEYLIQVSRAEIMLGAPFHRVEDRTRRSAAVLGIPLTFIAIPNYLFFVFFDPSTRTSDVRIYGAPVSWSLGKLETLDRISHKVLSGKMSVRNGTRRTQELLTPSIGLYKPWTVCVAWVVVSACISTSVYGGGWREVGVSGALGLVVSLLFSIRGRISAYGELFEPSAAILVSFVTTALRNHVCYVGVILAPLTMALSGFSLILAVIEVFSSKTIQGAGRVVHALIRTFIAGYGLAFGQALWFLVQEGSGGGEARQGDGAVSVTNATCPPNTALEPRWLVYLITLPCMCAGFSVFLHASYRQYPWTLLAVVPGFLVNDSINRYVDESFVARAASGLTIGVVTSLQARFLGRTAYPSLLASTIILVPGSLGVRAALSLAGGSPGNSSLFLTTEMFLIAVGVSVGYYMGSLLIHPFSGEGKRSSLMLL